MTRGVCALFPAKPGPVTLLNLLPASGGYQIALLEGEAQPSEMVFPGNWAAAQNFIMSSLLDAEKQY